MEIGGGETVQGFLNKWYNQKAKNFDSKPYISDNSKLKLAVLGHL